MIEWWQALILICSGMVGTLIGVIAGGWLVYKAKTITMPSPFFQMPRKRDKQSESYLGDLFEENDEPDDELSSAAQRIRDQKVSPFAAALEKKIKGS